MPVMGWNQWVKWVAPLDSAQSFMAFATASAMAGSSGVPSRMVCCKARYTFLGRRSFMAASPKAILPKISGTEWVIGFASCLCAALPGPVLQANEKGAAGLSGPAAPLLFTLLIIAR